MPTATTRGRVPKRSTSGRAPARRRATPRRDVIALIKADHATVNQLFHRYQALSEGALKTRRRLAERLIKELSIHAAVEEQVLYPNALVALPRGQQLVREALKEHRPLKRSLARLDKTAPGAEQFDRLMRDIRDEVRHHVKEEEAADGIRGQLRKHVSRADLQRLATTLRAAKKAAPTRPHPNAPDTPPGNIVGTATAIADKSRDKITGRS